MCGICGYAHADVQHPINETILRAMNETIHHRGPDSDGYYLQPGVALAMRRLSIIDVAGGDQPIYNEDGTLAIVFNGEIYNFPELRKTLVSLGHEFQTNSDTECIVHAYESWGDDCLTHLNGMFAFALWDKKNQRLLVARDRTGIKPLYYAQVNGTFYFASELKALMAHPDMPKELDEYALDEYLTFEYVPAPRTILRHIKKLPPGHAVSYQGGNMQIWSYWDQHLDHSESNLLNGSFDDLAVQFRQVLKEAVRGEMLSDVPLGVFLSGGVDSSAVAALMTEINAGPVKSFSIAFEDASFNESHFARRVAEHLGTDHHELVLTSKKALEIIPRVGQFLDEPLADSSIVPTMLLCGFARQQVTVALGGDGGDEVLAGYSTLQAHRLMTVYQTVVPGPVRWLAQTAVNLLPTSYSNISMDFKLKRFAGGHSLPLEVRHHTWLGSFDSHEKEAILRRHLLRHPDATYDVVKQHLEHASAQHLLNRVLYLDMKMYLDGDILPKVDRASMSHSLEVRVPFLNYDVLCFLEKVPIDYKLQRLNTKALLRKAMEKDLPPEILARGKKGFNMPVARWLTGELREWAHDLLSYDRLKKQGIFNPDGVQKLLRDHMQQKRDARKQLWTLLIFQMWVDHWFS
ncbi:MAG: asparagine synthase (glutamine-hydrolyzing) [Anaerolineae bacterium]|nr:asparagine synthase (glutamine-hydrolyzing) [Anaerolineae bacterium]